MWEVDLETKEIEYCLWVILSNNHELFFRKTGYGNNFRLGLMCLYMRFPEVNNPKGLKISGFSKHETISSETFCQCSAENSSTFYCLQPRVSSSSWTLHMLGSCCINYGCGGRGATTKLPIRVAPKGWNITWVSKFESFQNSQIRTFSRMMYKIPHVLTLQIFSQSQIESSSSGDSYC